MHSRLALFKGRQRHLRVTTSRLLHPQRQPHINRRWRSSLAVLEGDSKPFQQEQQHVLLQVVWPQGRNRSFYRRFSHGYSRRTFSSSPSSTTPPPPSSPSFSATTTLLDEIGDEEDGAANVKAGTGQDSWIDDDLYGDDLYNDDDFLHGVDTEVQGDAEPSATAAAVAHAAAKELPTDLSSDHAMESDLVGDDFGGDDFGGEMDDDVGAEADTVTSVIGGSFVDPFGRHEQNKPKMTIAEKVDHIMETFDALKPIESDDPEDMQLWLECAAHQEAVMRYQNIVEKARDRKGFDSLGIMQKTIIRWFDDLKDVIDARQTAYLSGQDKRTGHKRYGPLLCSLPPKKLAVIVAHEAIMASLTYKQTVLMDSIPLSTLATSIGKAVETEVLIQQRLRERFLEDRQDKAEMEDDGDSADEDDLETQKDKSTKSTKASEPPEPIPLAVDTWSFTAGHLEKFMNEISRRDPKFKKNKLRIQRAIRRTKRAMNQDVAWSTNEQIHVGAALVSILLDHAKMENGEPAFKIGTRWESRLKARRVVEIDESLKKQFLEDQLRPLSASASRYEPMIVPPNDWEHPNRGGYKWLRSEIMRHRGCNTQRDALSRANLDSVFQSLNVLNRTPWNISKEILRVAQHCWENDIAIGDIPTRTDFDVPPEPHELDHVDPEVWADKEHPDRERAIRAIRQYNADLLKRRRTIQKNMDLNSLRCSVQLKMKQAEKFQDFERIYFPHNLDFRGRAYPIPPHLSNVGSDLSRGLLKFADAKPLGKKGLYWLKVHLANFAGKDKMSFDDRAKFVDDNIENVRASVDLPFSKDPWWMTLEDPFQGLATCYEIIQAIDSGDPESYECSLPVHMDGSCNGLQHYAALGRDTVGGKAVNLLESDGPQDVYIGVMHEVIRRVAEEAERDIDIAADTDIASLSKDEQRAAKFNRAAKLVNGLIDRSVVKRTVMTSVYGVTYIGARDQILEKIEEKLEQNGHDIDEISKETRAASGYLATITMEVMGDLFQGARKTQTWLTNCARIMSQFEQPVVWMSPIGVPVVQPYRQTKTNTIITMMRTIAIVNDSDDLPINKRRQVTAFPPNFVHSLDSSHMLLTAMEMDKRGLFFSAVHDSFWTHACDIDEMNSVLRDCFVDLYSKPLLEDLRTFWTYRYPGVEFPEVPEYGDLDLEEVKRATYFFQ